ncbi:hypothetical protein BCAH1134_C0709 (plasmid) [Bacillus cereus AH1134]|nr:hypothetical protein BCAH1134_C0709 [Bacillus cereus AH1134]
MISIIFHSIFPHHLKASTFRQLKFIFVLCVRLFCKILNKIETASF